MGTIWIVLPSPRVARLAKRVIDNILSISAELSEGGLTFSELEFEPLPVLITIHITI
jgi:hypothetical protein